MLDFDQARFDGRLYAIDGATDTWNVFFDGELRGAELDVTGIKPESYYFDGTTTYYESGGFVNADLSLILTGTNAEALAVAYEFEFASSPANYFQGAFVAILDQRLSVAEMNGMQYAAVMSGGCDCFALSTSASGQEPVFAVSANIPGDELYGLTMQNAIYRPGSVITRIASHDVSANAAYEVNWGRWDASGTLPTSQTDPANGATKSNITNTLFWMTFTPTPVSVIVAKTGTFNYNTPVDILAGSIGGSGDGLVDFRTV